MKRSELEHALEMRDKEASGMQIIVPSLIGTLLGGIIGNATDPSDKATMEGIGNSREHKAKVQLAGTLGGLGFGLLKHLTSRGNLRRMRRAFG